MLLPKKEKYRKVMKGRVKNTATSGTSIAFGDFGLKSLDNERITSRQIEAARQAMTRYVKRGGRIWIRIFPHTPVSGKPVGLKMGKGKGNPEYHAAKVKAGHVMFEIADVTEEQAREALRLASNKLPVRTKFVSKETL